MNTRMVTIAMAAAVSSAALAESALPTIPEVTSVTMKQAASRLVTVEYMLKNAPAIVTVDVLTNGVSIGGENIDCLDGDVNRIVRNQVAADSEKHVFTWRPDLSWPDHRIKDGSVTVKVAAYAPDEPPQYMVVDLSGTATDRLRFYPAKEFVPGGVVSNEMYRQSRLVMRRIRARNVEWTMGESNTHTVKMPSDYYIAVFPMTTGQWNCLGIPTSSVPAGYMTEPLCPRDNVSYDDVIGYCLPKLAALVPEVAFTLPSEAQWEFACRGGHGIGYWGDGSLYINGDNDANLSKIGRNTASDSPKQAGARLPNSYDLYDMNGYPGEWCLDWWTADITANVTGAAVTAQGSATKRVKRMGASYKSPWKLLSGYRDEANSAATPGTRAGGDGFRLACPVSLTVQ